MMGSSHKAIGVASGMSIVLYAVETGNPILALGMISAPIGAMWPDIDHHNSKLGRTNDKVFSTLKRIAWIALICVIGLFVVSSTILAGVLDLGPMFKILYSVAGVSLMIIVSQSKMIHDKFPFLTRHRGIMHTAVIPVLLVSVTFGRCPEWIVALAIGFSLGYMSHLIADSCTTDGSPLAWPITEKPINFMKIKTNTPAEKVVAAVLCIIIIYFGVMFGSNPEMVYYVYALIAVVLGMGIIHLLATSVFKKHMKILMLISTVVTAVGFVSRGDMRLVVIAFGIGCLLNTMKYMFK